MIHWRTAVLALLALSFLASLAVAQQPSQQPPQQQHKSVDKPKSSVGVNSYGAVTLEALQSAGLIKLNGTSILDSLHVTGSLIANSAEIGSIEVSGEANLTDTTIRKGGSITGSLQAVRSTCEQPLFLLTQKAVFTNSRFGAVTVRKDMAFKGKQILELRQGTLINGPVHFEGGKGEILLFPGSQVLGPVTGGKVVKKL